MDIILEYFPFVLYVLGTILLIILIILGIKLIKTINQTNAILEDAYNKTKSLDGFFHVIDSVTDILSSISDKVVSNVTAVVGKILKGKRKKENEEDE